MDWLKNFIDKFSGDEDLKRLKEKKIHGSLKINFTDGEPINIDLSIHKKQPNL